ncbi:MAG: amidohydrolase family protein [Anaeromyxobacteraceae bacterium]
MTAPGRALLRIALLCAGGIALAIGVPAALERARPGITAPPEPTFEPAPLRRFDVHQHLPAATLDKAARLARARAIGAVANLSGGWPGGGLEESIAAAQEAEGPAARRGEPVRFAVLANLDPAGCCDATWAAREAERLDEAKKLGARGLALPPALGPGSTTLDGPALDPIFAASERLRLPVVADGPGFRDALLHRAARNPRLPFIATAFAGLAADPAAAGRLLDEHPNLYLETSAIGALGRAPAAARAAFLAHPDRILFGTDVRFVELPGGDPAVLFGSDEAGGREEMLRFFDGTYRFLETRDRGFPAPVAAEEHAIDGLGLPRAVLERVYHVNAEALFGVAAPDPRR